MMVGLQVAPAHPLPLSHLKKNGMRIKVEFPRLAREPLHESQQRSPILVEIAGWSAAKFLINLGPRANSVRPGGGQVEPAPFDEPAKAKIGIDGHAHFAHHATE